MPAISVLFLTRYPVEGASSRYRVYQYLPYLESYGVSCTVQSFMDKPMYQLSMGPGRIGAKIFATARAVWRRLAVLWQWQRYDIIYMQRELFPFGPPLLERWLKWRGAVLLFDYDDALFIKKASRYNSLATLLRSPGKTLEIFRIVDCTVAGNDWLRDAARAEGGVAETVDVAEDTNRIPMGLPKTADKPVTIGWMGSPSTVKYLDLISESLRRIAESNPTVRWEIMGGSDFSMEGVPWELHDWSLENELAALARYDIGLMPLPLEDWAKGKSGGKARTYMAAGVVPVVTGVGYNLELIDDGQTGFICRDMADWETIIQKLLDDVKIREQVGLAARADVVARFAPAGQAGKLVELFHRVLSQSKFKR